MNAAAAQFAGAQGWMKGLLVFLSSFLPFTESKGAVVLGAALNLKWFWSWILAGTGAGILVPILIFTRKFKSSFIDQMSESLTIKHPKFIKRLQKYGCIVLFVIISIPFTGIGVWLGSIASRILPLNKKHACLAVIVGNYIGTLITALCVYGIITGLNAVA